MSTAVTGFGPDDAWLLYWAGYKLGRSERAERGVLALYRNHPPECVHGGPCIGREGCRQGRADGTN